MKQNELNNLILPHIHAIIYKRELRVVRSPDGGSDCSSSSSSGGSSGGGGDDDNT